MNIKITEDADNCYGVLAKVIGWSSRVAARDVLVWALLNDDTGVGTINKPLLDIQMPCGAYVAFHTSRDIPWESVPCPCGNKHHWIIKYEEELNGS